MMLASAAPCGATITAASAKVRIWSTTRQRAGIDAARNRAGRARLDHVGLVGHRPVVRRRAAGDVQPPVRHDVRRHAGCGQQPFAQDTRLPTGDSSASRRASRARRGSSARTCGCSSASTIASSPMPNSPSRSRWKRSAPGTYQRPVRRRAAPARARRRGTARRSGSGSRSSRRARRARPDGRRSPAAAAETGSGTAGAACRACVSKYLLTSSTRSPSRGDHRAVPAEHPTARQFRRRRPVRTTRRVAGVGERHARGQAPHRRTR